MGSAFDAGAALAAIVFALALRPWRAAPAAGPPLPWLAAWAALPLLWSTDRLVAMPIVQPLSGAPLLVLMAGWPLAVPALAAAAALTALAGPLDGAQALHRLVWLGIVPGTLAVMFGAALRRWLPHHLMIYILGRGFFSTMFALAATAALALAAEGPPHGIEFGDLLLGRWLAAFGEATLTGMLVAIFVAFRPQWLATYSDRIYLPSK